MLKLMFSNDSPSFSRRRSSVQATDENESFNNNILFVDKIGPNQTKQNFDVPQSDTDYQA